MSDPNENATSLLPTLPPPLPGNRSEDLGKRENLPPVSDPAAEQRISLTNQRAIAGAVVAGVGILSFLCGVWHAYHYLTVWYAKELSRLLPDANLAWFFLGAHAVISVALGLFGYQMVKVGERLSLPLASTSKEEVNTPIEAGVTGLISFIKGVWKKE